MCIRDRVSTQSTWGNKFFSHLKAKQNSMADLDDFDKEINGQLDNLKKTIDALSKKDPSQRPAAIAKCQSEVKQINSWIETYELEIGGSANKKQYQESLKAIKQRYEQLKTELEYKKTEGTAQANLFANKSAARDPREMSSAEVIQLGDNTQKQSGDALTRIQKTVNEGNALADDVQRELAMQEEQIARMTNTVKDTQSILKRTDQLIRYFGRQVMTDKLLMCLLALIVIAIVTIIILKILGKGSGTNLDQVEKKKLIQEPISAPPHRKTCQPPIDMTYILTSLPSAYLISLLWLHFWQFRVLLDCARCIS
eukprot:TRINITY_DN8164_c0_g1_i1.p1 TRINITY_DN8164_c0_g1~~TRINITY_DN8164_c0_g1_i1.p1  ORF type:complete len:311 (+),score=67.27 TRINITY_DN8164_c0_g1_i1:3-935(+)